MDTLEKLRKLAIDQTHPGPACKPGEHYDSGSHHCVKVPAAEKAKDKPEKHQASETPETPVAKFVDRFTGLASYVALVSDGRFKGQFKVWLKDMESGNVVHGFHFIPDEMKAIAQAKKIIGIDGVRIQ